MSGPLTPSQTVGPFFGVGLPFEKSEQIVAPGSAGAIRIEGQVLDGNGQPVPDALLEIWQVGSGFGRSRTDPEGAFSFVVGKPALVAAAPDGRVQAPHLNVTVFARGLLRHLVTRLYFPDETDANASDPVLNLVEAGRRETLIARSSNGVLHFDVRLQGERETVFFAI
jgi:protocatechuate 3,4-dioxygenase alpha subunit